MRNYLLLAVLVLAGCSTPVTRAPWRSYPGALRDRQCNRYAIAAQEDLTLRGVEAFYVVYGWSNGNETGRHAVVIFQDAAGWWLVDNVAAWPMRIRGSTVMEMVKGFDSSAYIVWEASGMPIPLDWF